MNCSFFINLTVEIVEHISALSVRFLVESWGRRIILKEASPSYFDYPCSSSPGLSSSLLSFVPSSKAAFLRARTKGAPNECPSDVIILLKFKLPHYGTQLERSWDPVSHPRLYGTVRISKKQKDPRSKFVLKKCEYPRKKRESWCIWNPITPDFSAWVLMRWSADTVILTED